MTCVRTILATILACAGLTAIAQDDPVLVGTVSRVIDGDTIKVELSSGSITVRFGNIDAPESKQPGGQEAKAALEQLVFGKEVALDVVTQDRYERLVAVVYLDDGNVNEWLVKQGNAWAYRQYLDDPVYCELENEARMAHRGLWRQNQPVAPWEWRQHLQVITDYREETVAGCIAAKGHATSTRTASAPSSSQAASGCRIKGNVSSSGRIYHVPGSPSYDATKIDESKGERWFCTEKEAKAAGWRTPRKAN